MNWTNYTSRWQLASQSGRRAVAHRSGVRCYGVRRSLAGQVSTDEQWQGPGQIAAI
jgi:hypothetical protein